MALPCALLIAGVASAATPPFTNTTVVNGNLTPAANGAALLAAVAAANPPALVKVEPGFYDLGGQQLVMRSFVDVEGSGRDVTLIESSVNLSASNAVVTVASDVAAELRELTVRSTSSSSGVGIDIRASRFLLTEVNVEVENGTDAVGVRVIDASPRLNEVFVRVSSTGNAVGFLFGGGGAVVTDSFVFMRAQGGSNTALSVGNQADVVLESVVAILVGGSSGAGTAVQVVEGSKAQLNNVRASVAGSSAGGISVGGFAADDSSVDIQGSSFRVTGDGSAVALRLLGSARVTVTGSTLSAEGPSGATAVQAIGLGYFLDAHQSRFTSTGNAVAKLGGQLLSFGASQLVGGILNEEPGTLRCVFTYDDSYTPRAPNCE
ncbi:MAG: hypothetical protein AAF725_20415 [Acidobacteriota bacterium]